MDRGDIDRGTLVRDGRSGLAKMAGDQPVPARTFTFGGAGDRFGAETRWSVRALSAHEKLAGIAEAIKWLTRALELDRADLYLESGEASLELEAKVRALAVALVDPDDARKPWAKNADEVRKILEAEEIERIYEEVADFTDERAAFDRVKRWEEVEAKIVALGKGSAPKTLLNSYDTVTQRFIITELASRLYGPTKASSSPTSPASDSSTCSTPDAAGPAT